MSSEVGMSRLTDDELLKMWHEYGSARHVVGILRTVAEAAVAADRAGRGEPFCYASVNKQGDVTSVVKRKDGWRNIPLYNYPLPDAAVAVRGEPVAEVRKSGCDIFPDTVNIIPLVAISDLPIGTKLYTHPQPDASKTVVPEKLKHTKVTLTEYDTGYIEGWNACRDAILATQKEPT